MIDIGRGYAAGFNEMGHLTVVTGPLWAQIERERRDGPIWVAVLRGGERAARFFYRPGGSMAPASPPERLVGCPEGWFGR